MPNKGHNETIGGGGFHHVAIRVHDFDRSLKLYMEGLGFMRAYGWGVDERASGGKDSRAVLLETGDGNYLEMFAGGDPVPEGGRPESAILHFAFRTNDTDAALERARQAGARVTVEPKSVVPPHAEEPQQTFRIAFIQGFDGEVVEFFQNETL